LRVKKYLIILRLFWRLSGFILKNRRVFGNCEYPLNSPPCLRRGQHREVSSERCRGGWERGIQTTTPDLLAGRNANLSPPS
jgi:hypothetical protein